MWSSALASGSTDSAPLQTRVAGAGTEYFILDIFAAMDSVSLPGKNDVNRSVLSLCAVRSSRVPCAIRHTCHCSRRMSRGSSLTGCGNKSPEDGAASDDGVSSVRLNDLGKDIHRLWVLDHTNVVLAALVPSVVVVIM